MFKSKIDRPTDFDTPVLMTATNKQGTNNPKLPETQHEWYVEGVGEGC